MRRTVVSLTLGTVVCACAAGDLALAAKSKTPVTSSVKKLQMSPEELRIRVRALIRPTLGTVEEAADRIRTDATDPAVRRGALVWKIETTTTFLSALLRNDPVLALADAWGYAFQVEYLLARPDIATKYGPIAATAAAAMTEIQGTLRRFLVGLQTEIDVETFEATVRLWAEKNAIVGNLYRRPSMDSAVADVLATPRGGGAFAALGSLQETTSDVMMRMDLYTMYLPRLARWEAELAVDDLARGIDPEGIVADLDRITRAVDRLAAVAESAGELAARERAAVLESVREERIAATRDLQGERRAVLDAVREERIATLQEAEAIAQRLVDRSGGSLQAAVRTDLEDLVRNVEAMRKRLIDDAGAALNDVVDHAFLRAVQLLLIAAALAAVGVVLYARFLRRS